MRQGWIVSDWGALYGGVEYAQHGLDVGMASAPSFGSNLVQAVEDGKVPESRVTDMATR